MSSEEWTHWFDMHPHSLKCRIVKSFLFMVKIHSDIDVFKDFWVKKWQLRKIKSAQ